MSESLSRWPVILLIFDDRLKLPGRGPAQPPSWLSRDASGARPGPRALHRGRARDSRTGRRVTGPTTVSMALARRARRWPSAPPRSRPTGPGTPDRPAAAAAAARSPAGSRPCGPPALPRPDRLAGHRARSAGHRGPYRRDDRAARNRSPVIAAAVPADQATPQAAGGWRRPPTAASCSSSRALCACLVAAYTIRQPPGPARTSTNLHSCRAPRVGQLLPSGTAPGMGQLPAWDAPRVGQLSGGTGMAGSRTVRGRSIESLTQAPKRAAESSAAARRPGQTQ